MKRTALVLVGFALACAGCDLFDGGGDTSGFGTGGVGAPCPQPPICRTGLVCNAGFCAPSGTRTEGTTCALTGDCAPGLYCGAARVCARAGSRPEGGDCESTSDCMPGLLCRIEGFGAVCHAAGTGDLNASCATELDCLAGLSCADIGGGTFVCQNTNPIDLGDGGVAPPTLPFWPGVSCEVDDGPPVSYFRVPRGTPEDGDFHRLPFPSDVRRTADGLNLSGHPTPGTALSIDVLGRTIEAAEEDLDGWATNPVVYFRFSRGYDAANIADHFRWVDITPGSPEYGRDRGAAWITTYGPITRYICPDWIAFRSGHGAPLRPGTTYALILTRGLRTPEMASFQSSPDLDAVIADAMPTDPIMLAAWESYAPLRAWAADTTFDLSTVLNAAVFTTQTVESDVPAIRSVIRARPAPTLSDVTVCAEGVTSPCDDGTEQRRCGAPNAAFTEIHARVSLPIFQEGTAPYETPEAGGGLARDATGAPTVVREEPVCMMMTIPTGAPPPEGFPLVIAAHGTGGSFTGPIGDGLAETWATGDVMGAPVRAATIAFDLPQHGARRGASMRDPDRLVFNFANPRAARDVWLQGASDLLSLVYFAEGYAADAATSPTGEAIDFDATRIVIWAHSQGSTHAALMTPFEPSLSAILLSGVGGDLTESLLTKSEPVDIASLVPIALLDPDGAGNLAVGDYHPALQIIQTLYERVDPVNFGRRMWLEPVEGDTGRHLFMTYGIEDHYSTERTMRAFAGSARLPHVTPERAPFGLTTVMPPVSGNAMIGTMPPRTVGMRQYLPPDGSDGHFVSTTTGRTDTTRFVLEALAGLTPTIGE